MTPVSIIVFVLGIAMVVWSLTRSGDSTTSTVPDRSVVSEEDADSGSSGTAIAQGSMSTPDSTAATASSGVTVSSSATTPAPTRAPGSPSTPTTVAPSVTVRPLSPGAGAGAGAATTTVAPLSIPPLVATPGTIAPAACTSFKDCAQKLFDAWESSDRNAKTQALNYATPEAVNTLFYVRTIGVVWEPTVFRSTALKYVASGTVTTTGRAKAIEFIFTSGQSGYKVQSVVLY